MSDTRKLSLKTLSGDIRDEMLTRFKQASKPWRQMTEDEQRQLASGVELFSSDFVRDVVALVTQHDFARAVVKLEEVKIAGKAIVGKITADNIAVNRDVLGENVTSYCQLVMIDSEEFIAAREKAKIDLDQANLDLGSETEEAEPEAEAAEEPQDAPLMLPKPTADLMSPEDDDRRPDAGDLE